MRNKTLAIIGASYLQLPLVLKAAEMGIRTLCFAWRDGAVCQSHCSIFFDVSITEKEHILDICRKESIDGICTIASDVAVPTVNYIAHEMGLIGNSLHSGQISTNKFAMREALSDAGCSCPPFLKIRTPQDAVRASQILSYPLIIKPCDRSGSMGVTKVNDESDLFPAAETALNASFSHEAIIEKHIDIAHEISIEGISWQGEYHLLAVTDKVTTGPPHYVEIGQHQPCLLPKEILDVAVRQATEGVKALGIRYGASHSELMIDTTGKVYITEIGSRMGGDFIGSDLVCLSTGYDFLRGVIEIALGSFSGVHTTLKKHAGVWFYTPNTRGVRDIIEHSADHPFIRRSEIHPEELKTLTRSADRAGYFIYQADKRIDVDITDEVC